MPNSTLYAFILSFLAGLSTFIGALIIIICKNKNNRVVIGSLSFAAGVMLSAAVIGLIIPSIEHGGKFGILVTVAGVFCGALCVNVIDKLMPHLHRLSGVDQESHPDSQNRIDKVLLFVVARCSYYFNANIILIQIGCTPFAYFFLTLFVFFSFGIFGAFVFGLCFGAL